MKTEDKAVGKLNSCQICNSKKLHKIIKMGSTGLCDSLLTKNQLQKGLEKSFPLNMYRCPKCQLLQLNYVVDNKKLFHLNYPYKSGITKPLKKLLHDTSKYLKNNFVFSKNALAIDLGSNDGTLLEGFKKKKI